MIKEHLIVFHQKTPQGWAPGNFMARTRVDEKTAQRINDRFNASGVKVIPFVNNDLKRANPFLIE